MRDAHLTPVLTACTPSELAPLIEFLGRPPLGSIGFDHRLRRAGRDRRIDALVAEVLHCGDHGLARRFGAGRHTYLQVVCDVLQQLGLPETPGADIGELELRIVRHVLDSEFDRLAPAVQDALLAAFTSGELFAAGLLTPDPFDPLLTHVSVDDTVLALDKTVRAVWRSFSDGLPRRVADFILFMVLHRIDRRLEHHTRWAVRVWRWLGPAYRLTVPVICYVHYLRQRTAAAPA